eukprot:snap_masked-scaffold_42-processed-gene-2.7-mRNA-1 protein AED:1.00 eAED:1.00 QI:0/0/0/0/1/1/2/0/72
MKTVKSNIYNHDIDDSFPLKSDCRWEVTAKKYFSRPKSQQEFEKTFHGIKGPVDTISFSAFFKKFRCPPNPM